MTKSTWDPYFLGMATYVARKSKDPSTQVGAVIVRPDKTVASVGFNGFPRGMNDDAALYENREIKLSRVIHAEMNAILNAHGPVEGYTLYCTLLPCDRCAVFVVQAGIQRVVTMFPPAALKERWGDAFERTEAIFREAGVRLDYLYERDLEL
jgi:dCMP deaminase